MIVDYTCTMDMYDMICMICMICNSRLEYLRCTMYGSTFVPRYCIRKYYFRIIILSYENRYSIFVRKYIYTVRTTYESNFVRNCIILIYESTSVTSTRTSIQMSFVVFNVDDR